MRRVLQRKSNAVLLQLKRCKEAMKENKLINNSFLFILKHPADIDIILFKIKPLQKWKTLQL